MSAKEQPNENADLEEADEPDKHLYWIGRSLDDLRNFPEEVRQTIGFGLWQAQQGGKHVDAKPLKGLGGGVVEIVADERGGAFRGVYTVKFSGAVYVLHVFQKKSKKGIATPKHEMDLIRTRLRLAADHYKQLQVSEKKRKQNEQNKSGKGKKK
jgi:phage-related protein